MLSTNNINGTATNMQTINVAASVLKPGLVRRVDPGKPG